MRLLPHLPLQFRSRVRLYLRRFRRFLIRVRRRMRQGLFADDERPDPFNPALYTLISRPYERPLVSSLKKKMEVEASSSSSLPPSPSPKGGKKVRLLDPAEIAASESKLKVKMHVGSKTGSTPWVPNRASSLKRRLATGGGEQRVSAKGKTRDVMETLFIDFPAGHSKAEDDGWADASPISSPAGLSSSIIRVPPSPLGPPTASQSTSYFHLGLSVNPSSKRDKQPPLEFSSLLSIRTGSSSGCQSDPHAVPLPPSQPPTPPPSVSPLISADLTITPASSLPFPVTESDELSSDTVSATGVARSAAPPPHQHQVKIRARQTSATRSRLHHSPRRRAVGAE
jgi:hypothetical protein